MTRKRKQNKQSMSYVPALVGEDWVASWSARFGYVPPPVVKRGQLVRRVEGVLCDPTLFTPLGPSKKTLKGRASRARSTW